MKLFKFTTSKGDSLKKDFSWYILPTVLSFILGFITFPFIVKNITVSAFGTFNYLQIIAGFVGMFLGMGLGAPFQQALYSPNIKEPDKSSILYSIFILKNFLLLGVGGMGLIIYSCFARFPIFYYFFIYFALYFAGTKNLPVELLRKNRQAKIISLLTISDRLINTLGVILLFSASIMSLSSLLILGIARCVVMSLFYLKYFKLSEAHSFSLSECIKSLKIGISTLPAAISNWVIQVSDRFFLMKYKGSYDLGIYSANLKMEFFANMFVVALHNTTYPVFCTKLGEGDEGYVKKKYETA